MSSSRLTFELLGRDNASPVFDRFGKRIDDTSRRVGMFDGALGRVGGTVAALGFGKLITDSVKLEAAYSKTMAQVAVATAAPKKSLAELDALAMKMGADTVFSAQDAGAAMLELAKGGLSEAEIRGGALANTLTLAAAGGLELGDAANVVVQAMGAFQLGADDTGAAVAALGGAANSSSADVSDITQALAQAGTSANAAGLSIQDTTAYLAMFADQGIKGSDAGTSLRTMLTRLVPQTDKAAAAMDALNLSYTDRNGKLVDAEEIAARTQKAFKGLTDEERTRAINTIFGADAQRAANVLIDQGETGLKKYKTATSDLTQAQKLADASMSGTSGALEQLSGSFETAKIQVGKGLAPVVEDLANRVSDMVEDGDFEEFGKRTGEVLADLGDVAIPLAEDVLPAMGSALSAAATAAQVLAPAVKAVVDAFGAMPEWAQAVVVGGWAVNKATGGNLIPPIIAAPGGAGRGGRGPVVAPTPNRSGGAGRAMSGGGAAPKAGPGILNSLGIISVASALGSMHQDKLLDSLNEKGKRLGDTAGLTRKEIQGLSDEIMNMGRGRRGGGGTFDDQADSAERFARALDKPATSAEALKIGLEEVSRRNAKPKVGLLGVPRALGDLGDVFGELTKVDEKDPKPRANILGVPGVLAKVGDALERMGDLDDTHATPSVSLSTGGLAAQVGAAQALINSIQGARVGVSIGVSVATAGKQADGGPIIGHGGPRQDNLLFWGSNGEHTLPTRDVDALGGQHGVYALRRALQAGTPISINGGSAPAGPASMAELERKLDEQTREQRETNQLLRMIASQRGGSLRLAAQVGGRR